MDSILSGRSHDNGTNFVSALLQGQGQFFLWDEHVNRTVEVVLHKFSSHQHCVLFMSEPLGSQGLPDFEVMHLDACLRSTGQLAAFANNLVNISELASYSTHPSRSFEGERVVIKFSGETGDKTSFMDLSVKTIVEYAQKIHDVGFLPVANLLQTVKLHLIKESLEKLNYTCCIDDIPPIFEEHESPNGCSMKTPVILFFDPIKYEGCEFPVVLILMDKSICLTKVEKDKSFLTALTRASLNLVIIVDDSSPPEEELKRAIAAEQSKLMEDHIKVTQFYRCAKPIFLVFGRCPDEGQFKRELNPPQMYLPDIDGISCYVGRHSRFLHIDDVYLESDLKKLHDFGIKFILFCSKSIECEWHHLYLTATNFCLTNFQQKTPYAFEKTESIWPFLDQRKFSIKRLSAFLKQQSGESDTTIPVLHFNFQPHTLPEIDTDWLKWKSKAVELYRIHETAMARNLYFRSILLLKTERENNFQQGNTHGALKSSREIAKLYTNISKIQLEWADGIFDGQINPGVGFWEAILNAFMATMHAMGFDPCWSRSYERMHAVVKKLKSRSCFCSTDSCDSHFDYRATFSDLLNKNNSVLSQKIKFLKRLDELYDSIELSRKTVHEKTDEQLWSTISSKAATLSQKSLKLIKLRDVQCGSNFNVMLSGLSLLATQARFIFEISVRLALISSKYSLQTKCPEEVLHSALNKLEEVVSRIRKIGVPFRLQIEKSHSMASIEN